MKSATKHAEDLRALFKKLLKEKKPAPKTRLEPLRALVRGSMLFDVTEARADDAMKVIDREFVDLNELRVATELEVQEMLGPKYPQIERRAALVTAALNAIFEKEHTLNLDRLGTISKRDARQFLRELPNMVPFVEGYIMLMSFEGGCIPLDNITLEYLRAQGIVEPATDVDEAQRFLEHHIKAEEAYEFFMVAREAALAAASDDGKKKKK